MASNDDIKDHLQVAFQYTASEQNPILHAVGEAISAWGGVEIQVCNVFLAVAHPQGFPFGVPAGFSSIASFDAKLKVIGHVLSYSLDENEVSHVKLLLAWSKLSAKLRKLNLKRNEIAHGLLYSEHPNGDSSWGAFPNFSNALVRFEADRSITKAAKEIKPLDLQTLRAREKAFVKVIDIIGTFIEADLKPVTRGLELFSSQSGPVRNLSQSAL